MSTTQSRAPWGPVAIATLLVSGGCSLPGVPTSATGLPAALQAIVDDPNSFAPSPEDPLADVTPGTVIDDLSGLTGCWGWFEQALCPLSGRPLTAFYEVYRFGTDSGTVSRWVYTSGVAAIPPVVTVDEGGFTVIGDGRIEIQLDRYTIIDMRTGIGREFTELPEEIGTLEKLITLAGDQLLIADPSYVDEGTGQPAGRIFTRFDCPGP
jgi:hypothetical protein